MQTVPVVLKLCVCFDEHTLTMPGGRHLSSGGFMSGVSRLEKVRLAVDGCSCVGHGGWKYRGTQYVLTASR